MNPGPRNRASPPAGPSRSLATPETDLRLAGNVDINNVPRVGRNDLRGRQLVGACPQEQQTSGQAARVLTDGANTSGICCDFSQG